MESNWFRDRDPDRFGQRRPGCRLEQAGGDARMVGEEVGDKGRQVIWHEKSHIFKISWGPTEADPISSGMSAHLLGGLPPPARATPHCHGRRASVQPETR